MFLVIAFQAKDTLAIYISAFVQLFRLVFATASPRRASPSRRIEGWKAGSFFKWRVSFSLLQIQCSEGCSKEGMLGAKYITQKQKACISQRCTSGGGLATQPPSNLGLKLKTNAVERKQRKRNYRHKITTETKTYPMSVFGWPGCT